MLNKKRITISMETNIHKQIRYLQSKLITTTGDNWSFSAVTNKVLDKGLKQLSKSKKKRN